MSTTNKPVRAVLRAYQVGFGDCMLLTFEYVEGDKRHVLIDFGSTGIPTNMPDNLMLLVAEDIRKQTRKDEKHPGKLHMLIASHRHKDHIGGFSREGKTNSAGETTGDIIRSLNPEVVIQPWTEDPDLEDAEFKEFIKQDPKKKSRTATKAFAVCQEEFQSAPEKHFASTLMSMQVVAENVEAEAQRLIGKDASSDDYSQLSSTKRYQQELRFMGENNLPNASAVKNLREMGVNKIGEYVKFGDRISLSKILPGVKLHILGPPSLEQHHEIVKQRSRDDSEFWMLHSMLRDFWGLQAATASLSSRLTSSTNETPSAGRLFPKAKVFKKYTPSHTRWFINQIKNVRANQMLGLVRILDKAMNNTSVIALFEINGHKLLFPGDAQIENWEYALKQPEKLELLKDAILYKVGHHGSRNATPKTLWRNFENRSEQSDDSTKLFTVCSTMAGKHGHTAETAVPRSTLVAELKKRTRYR
jgi:ribonuclease BN (tRNA processing enzyme)